MLIRDKRETLSLFYTATLLAGFAALVLARLFRRWFILPIWNLPGMGISASRS